MILSSRHRQIVNLLIKQREDITAGEIAAEINVSTRTVHRELAELEGIMAEHGLTLLKKAGKGIQLQGESDQLAAFQTLLQDETAVEHSAQERKVLILCTLLTENEPVKLFTLAHDMSVTVPTITHDLDDVEQWMAQCGLTLIRRRGYGVELAGTETNKRKLIRKLANSYLDDSDLFGKADDTSNTASHMLLELIGKVNFRYVEGALWQDEDRGLGALSESEYTELLIDVSICIARIQQGKLIEQEPNESLTLPKNNLLLQHIIEHIKRHVDVDFPSAEVEYLVELLNCRVSRAPSELLPDHEPWLIDTIGRLIARMEQIAGLQFRDDKSLSEGLLTHLGSALRRLRAGINIRNPLLSQIKRDYEPLFLMIRRAVDVTIPEIDVPDEEIGFLVMHFGASMERLKQFRRDVSAIIVCTSGIGTSKMLAVRLTKEFPQIEIIGNASWFEAARIPAQDYDLIISTVDLPIPEERYIKLSPLLSKDDADRLRSFIHNVTLNQGSERKLASASAARDPNSSVRLRRIQHYVNEIVRIVDQFKLYVLEQAFVSLDEALHALCQYPKLAGIIEEAQPVVELLLEREKQSSQVIPETGIALFHIRSQYVRSPFLTLFRFEHPLLWKEEAAEAELRQALLMLGPQELSKESLEVLSEISSYLLIPEMLQLLKEGSEQEIKQFLSQELAQFLENKK
ncbi:BglG family transcription antiterminator [Paenibacillus hexagrammi]|uniref:BglG family transcription antiterminator n=1 Tax=Paenibacillus hexagrammi TaxID=2908839 RepID=A0ABY3SCI5_9BACL|nr:BglG family transcription antiterminator [Paenibacillus sp. YPD9-1]UJF31717.1 BglG family transcription antiterminator [Paenibacillus sp. YPD9-1]